MNLFSQDKALSDFVEKAYIKLLEASYTINSENIKEIPYGVTLKTGKSEDKLVSVAIYHTEKKGFSHVTTDPEINRCFFRLSRMSELWGVTKQGRAMFSGRLSSARFCLVKKRSLC